MDAAATAHPPRNDAGNATPLRELDLNGIVRENTDRAFETGAACRNVVDNNGLRTTGAMQCRLNADGVAGVPTAICNSVCRVCAHKMALLGCLRRKLRDARLEIAVHLAIMSQG